MTKNKSRTRIKFNTRLKGLDFFAYQICLQKKKEWKDGRKKRDAKFLFLFSFLPSIFKMGMMDVLSVGCDARSERSKRREIS